jgi:uncharacterized protein YgbK (DUF1537 family)
LIVPDISSPTEVARLACKVNESVLCAGAADFFAALLAERCHVWKTSQEADAVDPVIESPALLVCGSRASWLLRCDECRAAVIPIVTVEQLFVPSNQFGAVLLGIANQSSDATPSQILSRLAESTAAIMSRISIKTLLAEGGATAATIATQFGWHRFAVVAVAPAGVGVLRPLAPSAPLMLIKPGSYSWPATIWQAFCRCGK